MSDLIFRPDDHTYWIGDRQIPNVTSILRDAGLVSYPPNADDARLLGKNVHEGIHYFDTPDYGELDWSSLYPPWLPYLTQYVKFKEATGFQVIRSESPTYSGQYGYAGTIDKIGQLNGSMILLDIKTGSPAKWHVLQLAAYDQLVHLEEIEPGAKILKAFNLYLTPTTYKLREASYTDLRYGFEVFCAALTLYRFKEA